MNKEPVILLVGAGAVGATISAWLAPVYENFYVLDQGATLEAINANGVAAYLQHEAHMKEHARVKTIQSFDEIEKPDYILLCVKNYSLHGLSSAIREAYGDEPVIVGFQNGIDNQTILPQYFSKVVYGVVCYNAWLDEPGVAGYQKKGPLVIGSEKNQMKRELNQLQAILNRSVETVVTPHIQDAVISKMIINLTNSFTTLVGFTFKPIEDESLFQKILTNLTYEGVKIAKAAGYDECKMGGMPGWNLMTLSTLLPQFLTRGLFKKNVSKMVVSSMAQDVLQNHRGKTELDSINGYLLELAEKHGVDAPYNRAIYELCQKCFASADFEPLDVRQVWQDMNALQPVLA